MAKKKRARIATKFVEVVSDVANAFSVAATGSQIGMLELAAEDELKESQPKRVPRAALVSKRRAEAKRATKPAKKKRKPTRKRRRS